MLLGLIWDITELMPTGLQAVFFIFFYGVGVFLVVSVVTSFIAIVNHVRGLITRG